MWCITPAPHSAEVSWQALVTIIISPCPELNHSNLVSVFYVRCLYVRVYSLSCVLSCSSCVTDVSRLIFPLWLLWRSSFILGCHSCQIVVHCFSWWYSCRFVTHRLFRVDLFCLPCVLLESWGCLSFLRVPRVLIMLLCVMKDIFVLVDYFLSLVQLLLFFLALFYNLFLFRVLLFLVKKLLWFFF